MSDIQEIGSAPENKEIEPIKETPSTDAEPQKASTPATIVTPAEDIEVSKSSDFRGVTMVSPAPAMSQSTSTTAPVLDKAKIMAELRTQKRLNKEELNIWKKDVIATIGEAKYNDKGLIVGLGESAVPYPDSFARDIIENFEMQAVVLPERNITVIDDVTNDDKTYKRMIVTLSLNPSDRSILKFFADEIGETVAEALAVSIDQYATYGGGTPFPLGLFPRQKDEQDNRLPYKQLANTKTILSDRTNDINRPISYQDIHGMVDALTKIVGEDEIVNAKWYMNSNIGLQLATTKKNDNDYIIDQTDEALVSVGIPDKIEGYPIVYNEWMDDIDSDSIPIIFAILKGAYEIKIRLPMMIQQVVEKLKDGEEQNIFVTAIDLYSQPIFKEDGSLQPYVGLLMR